MTACTAPAGGHGVRGGSGHCPKAAGAKTAPPLVVGSYILASSGFPLQVIFGQIPAIWSGCTDLTEREAMTAAIIGAVIKVLTAALFATCLQFLYM